ncbi:adenosine deaminase [Streptobacillus notomytis]|uniref:adenosine deaminase n=1 Tax=Streptobacillus notomytis TaxID=1712031 RepID=UPI0008368F33|nr:adenosine deaminase [Streptobacillus notomytis]
MKREVVKKLPKVELHCHLDGSIPIDTLYKLAIKEGIEAKKMDKVFAPKKCIDLKDYLNCFDVVLEVLQSKENLTEAAYSVVKEVYKENVKYIEIRFAPLLHIRKGLSIKEVVLAVSEGIRKAQQEVDVKVNILICALRHHKAELNNNLLEEVYKLNIIAGFDFAGDEKNYSNSVIKETAIKVKEKNLKLTLHAGECGCAQSVVEAIHLGATRIGHGVAIKDDVEAMKYVVNSDVLLEICPTSNIQTDAIDTIEEYPFRIFMENGVKCCINTDNRTVSNTTLTDEYMLLNKYFGLTYEEMKKLNINAINFSFADEDVKENILENILEAYKEYM